MRPLRENLVSGIVNLLYDLKIPAPSRFFIDTDLNEIVYANHLAQSDVPVIYETAGKFSGKTAKETIIIASQWHMANKKSYRRMLKFISWGYGVKVLPVIQDYMAKNPENFGYTSGDVNCSYRRMMTNLQEINRTNQGNPSLRVIIFPEGHRSDDGIMQSPDNISRGFFKIGQLLAPVVFRPFGIRYENNHNRNTNIQKGQRTPIEVIPGQPVFMQDRNETGITPGLLLNNLIDTLPPSLRPPEVRR